MQIAIPLYRRFTALDAIGPYEVLARLPGAEVTFVASRPDRCTDRQRHARASAPTPRWTTCPGPTSSWCPGGSGTRRCSTTSGWSSWIRAAHETSTWTTSVCTGSLLLGAAGRARRPGGHHPLARHGHAAALGRHAVERRVVEQGKVITAAGVSSGIDMALTLVAQIAGDDVAQAIQLGIEYDPQPPFDAGSPAKAPASVLALVRAAVEARDAERPAGVA